MESVVGFLILLAIVAFVLLVASCLVISVWALRRELAFLVIAGLVIAGATVGAGYALGWVAEVPVVGGVVALVMMLGGVWFFARGAGPSDGGFVNEPGQDGA